MEKVLQSKLSHWRWSSETAKFCAANETKKCQAEAIILKSKKIDAQI